MEANVYVRYGSPWICTLCPKCGNNVYESEKYCKACGTQLSFNDFKMAVDIGDSICRTQGWTRYIPNKMDKMRHFFEELKGLEKAHQIEDTSMVKIMRDAYYKTCADELMRGSDNEDR